MLQKPVRLIQGEKLLAVKLLKWVWVASAVVWVQQPVVVRLLETDK